jgi:hypothetical protein
MPISSVLHRDALFDPVEQTDDFIRKRLDLAVKGLGTVRVTALPMADDLLYQ